MKYINNIDSEIVKFIKEFKSSDSQINSLAGITKVRVCHLQLLLLLLLPLMLK